jgi:hypothetical protein
MFLIYGPKRPSFSTIYSYAPNVALHKLLPQFQVQCASKKSPLLVKCSFNDSNSTLNNYSLYVLLINYIYVIKLCYTTNLYIVLIVDLLHVISSIPAYWLLIVPTYDTHATDWNSSPGRRQVWAGNVAFRHHRLLHSLSLFLSPLHLLCPFQNANTVYRTAQFEISQRFVWTGQIEQACSTFRVVRGGISTKFGLHAGNLKFSTQNEETNKYT